MPIFKGRLLILFSELFYFKVDHFLFLFYVFLNMTVSSIAVLLLFIYIIITCVCSNLLEGCGILVCYCIIIVTVKIILIAGLIIGHPKHDYGFLMEF